MKEVFVIGAGLAGSEAALALAKRGIKVKLMEMKPEKFSPAHSYNGFAELVCSNSLKAKRLESAGGLLKEEMRVLGSATMESAGVNGVSAGGALAVDREKFSDYITEKIRSNENIEVISGEVTQIPEGNVIIATGPLTSDKMGEAIKNYLTSDYLSFFDAAAPIVSRESIDENKTFLAARYDRGEADYINCPMNKEEYLRFYNELINAQGVELKEFDKRDFKVFEGCMPVEVMAKRGEDTLRFGPLKPVGLRDPRTGERPYAVVQLRCENKEKTLYNLVGFQTNLKFPEQKRVFSLIPGLENAEFMRYGVMHRNTFINSPKLLTPSLNLRKNENVFFAGQITGVEGYIESAASGILAGINMARELEGKELLILPRETMLGALLSYISDPYVENFQPMSSNMGILPSLPERIKDKTKKYGIMAEKALNSLRSYLSEMGESCF